MNYNFSIDSATENPLSVIVNNIRPGSKVFEFGPSKGYMTAYLKQALNCTVYCVEINSEAAKQAEQYCDHMIVGDLNEDSWYDQLSKDDYGTFDYLIYADVLEHLVNPETVLNNAVEQLLKDSGEVFISVPHIGHTAVILELLEGRFDYRDTGLLDSTHLRFFTRNNVEKLLGATGLVPTKWNMICMHPEQTELKKSYEFVPKAVKNYLENKIDAHVYQFIVFSSKKSNIIEEVSEKYSYRHSEFLQLFWDTGNGYNEVQSSRVPIDVKDRYITYKIEFQAKELRSLRIDPTNFISFIHLRKIIAYGVSRGNNSPILLGDLTSAIHPHNKVASYNNHEIHLLALDEDPQVIIPVDFNSTKEYMNFILEIEMEVTSRLDGNLILGLIKDNQEYSRKETIYLEAIHRNKEINDQLKVFDEMYSSLENHKKQMEKKIIQLQEDCENYKAEIIKKDKTISSLLSSLSWRLTEPLRKIKRKK